MQKYANVSRKSGVDSFEITDSAIKVRFKNNAKIYTYTVAQNGSHVATMKQLAKSGKGLSGYIGKYRDTLKFTVGH